MSFHEFRCFSQCELPGVFFSSSQDRQERADRCSPNDRLFPEVLLCKWRYVVYRSSYVLLSLRWIQSSLQAKRKVMSLAPEADFTRQVGRADVNSKV